MISNNIFYENCVVFRIISLYNTWFHKLLCSRKRLRKIDFVIFHKKSTSKEVL